MSKKLDIDKLIESKYAGVDASNSLTLDKLISEIELVLEGLSGSGAEQAYGSKLPQEFEETNHHNVAADNPLLSSGHGVERASADGHSEGGTIAKPRIENPLPEANSKSLKQQTPAAKVQKMELEFFYPVLTRDNLGLSQAGEYDQNTLNAFKKACHGLGIYSKATLAEKFNQFKLFTDTKQQKTLVQSMASLMLMRSIYNTFAALGGQELGIAAEDIISALYGSSAKSVGAAAAEKYGSSSSPYDIVVGQDRFISLKTRADASFTTSFANVFLHVLIYGKSLEVFWIRKKRADVFIPSFDFVSAYIDSSNVHEVLRDGNSEDRKNILNLTKQLYENPDNKEMPIKKLFDTAVEQLGLSSQTYVFPIRDSSKAISLAQLVSRLPGKEASFSFDFDVEKLVEASNLDIKNIYNDIKLLHGSIAEFVSEFNNFVYPGADEQGVIKILNPSQGDMALNKAKQIPEYAQKTILGIRGQK